VRLSVDPKTNNLIVLARPAQHATIRATLEQLQREGQRVDVVRLRRLDPELVVASINKLFAGGEPGKGGAPLVDADPDSRQLMIRGTEAQIAQIRGMLEKMGEPLAAVGDAAGRGGNVRTRPLSESAARGALERLQEVWPTLRPNKIRIISPAVPAVEEPSRGVNPPAPPAVEPSGAPPAAPPLPAERSVGPSTLWDARLLFVSDAPPEAPAPPPIVVMPSPRGLVIASDDAEALDEFERLLEMLVDNSPGGRGVTVFYLKYAKAAAVTETLGQILGGATTTSSGSSGSSRGGGFGDFNPMAEFFGGAFGDFGGRRGRRDRDSGEESAEAAPSATANAAAGRTGLATGPVKITADQRLNALLVRANRADLDTIEQLLKVLDQKESPEDISVAVKPRMIPVENTSAQENADIVKQVYAERIGQSAAASQQPMMPFFMRGGRGSEQSNRTSRVDEMNRLSIGVDARTNSLIVAATDAVFEEVRQLVLQLDVAAGDENQAVRVVTLHRPSPAAVQQALAAIAGDSVQMNRVAAPSASPFAPGGRQSVGNFPQRQFSGYGRQQGGFVPQQGGTGQFQGGFQGANRFSQPQQGSQQQGAGGGRRGSGRTGQSQR